VAAVQVCLLLVLVDHRLVLQAQMLAHKTATRQLLIQVQVAVETTTTPRHLAVALVVQELFTSGGRSSHGKLCKNERQHC
jgi:hypothetical protein